MNYLKHKIGPTKIRKDVKTLQNEVKHIKSNITDLRQKVDRFKFNVVSNEGHRTGFLLPQRHTTQMYPQDNPLDKFKFNVVSNEGNSIQTIEPPEAPAAPEAPPAPLELPKPVVFAPRGTKPKPREVKSSSNALMDELAKGVSLRPTKQNEKKNLYKTTGLANMLGNIQTNPNMNTLIERLKKRRQDIGETDD